MKTQTIADNAPAWAMPGSQVAYFSGYGEGSSYQARTVARHTRTTIILAPASQSSYAKEIVFKLRGRTWTESGEKTYAATIDELGGAHTQRVDRQQRIDKARAEAHNAAKQFSSRGRWAGAADAEELQAALTAFITTMKENEA